MAGAAGPVGRAPGRAAVACRTGAALPLVGRALRRQGQHRHRRRAHHRRLPGLRLHAPSATPPWCSGCSTPARVWLGKTNLDQFATGLVGTRSPYGAAGQHLRRRAHQRRLQLGLGRGRGARRRAASRWAPTPPARAACRRASTTSSASSPRPGASAPPAWCRPAAASTASRSSRYTVDDAARVLARDGRRRRRRPLQPLRAPGPARLPAHGRASACRPPAARGRRRLTQPLSTPPCAQARELGAELVRVDFAPLHEVAALLYDGPWVAERYSGGAASCCSAARGRRPGGARRSSPRATAFSAADAFEAQYRLRELRAQAAAAVAAGATCCWCPPPPATRRFGAGGRRPGRRQRAARALHQLRQPARLVRAGAAGRRRRADGLPFGVTFIAPGGFDAALARFGRRWARRCAAAGRHGVTALPRARAPGRRSRRCRWPWSARTCRACR